MFFKARVASFVIIAAVLFAILLVRLFNLQIVNADSYSNRYALKTEKEVQICGTRGDIYDCNNILLAHSELTYSVVIEDSGFYESKKIKNEKLNDVINRAINIIEKNGDTLIYDFNVICENDQYKFNISGDALLRFFRDVYGRTKISELKDEERNATPDDLMKTLKDRYSISDEYSKLEALRIAYVRYNLALNSYKRYISFTLSNNVTKETKAEIVENEDVLTGVTVKEDYIRKYTHSVAMSHILGYTGKVSQEELDKFKLIDDSYDANDVVGKAGIEASFETTLAGKKGSKKIQVDSVGRVLEVLEEKDSLPGQDVYLSIDVNLQEKLYKLLERRLAEILVSRIVSDESTTNINEEVVIPISDLYFAFFNNDVFSMEEIAKGETPTSSDVYTKFVAQKAAVIEALKLEISTNKTTYSKLPKEYQRYLTYIKNKLVSERILDQTRISEDSGNEIIKSYSEGNISFSDYLYGAIGNGWVNIYNLDVKSEYPSTEEVFSAIENTLFEEISDDTEFDKLIYEVLIDDHKISGKQICLLVMEQHIVDFTEEEYNGIVNGASTYDYLMEKINNVEITPAQLALDPCAGSCVVEDPNTGKILAMVSYPGYDINYFSGSIDSAYYAKLLKDKSTPLVNRATSTKIAPGSTYKPLIALAGLTEGVITKDTEITCDGEFDEVFPSIKCGAYPGSHGDMKLVDALTVSCNEYFCDVGYRLSYTPEKKFYYTYGLEKEAKYCELIGLGTKTGIEITESTPKISDYNSVASAIGQGTNAYTSLNLARYVSTVANKGTVYNSSLVWKVASNDKKTETVFEPKIANETGILEEYFNVVQEGMENVILKGVLAGECKKIPYTICGKSGTAQENKKRGDHANYVMFTKKNDGTCDIAVSVMIPNGYCATNAGIMAYYALSGYYNLPIPSRVYFNDSFAVIEDKYHVY